MRGGRTVEAGKKTAGITADELSYLMVGKSKAYERKDKINEGKEVLHINQVEIFRDNGSIGLNKIDFKLNAGEIYGMAGVGGNGQTELANILMGIGKIDSGQIIYCGEMKINNHNSRMLRKLGINSIPADRYSYAIAGDLSVMENYVISRVGFEEFGSSLWLNWNKMEKKTNEIIKKNDILGAKPLTKSSLLSGGNAQKLVLARELTSRSKVLVAHSPTRGLDVRACAAVHEGLRNAANNGTAVLMISEDLDEVLSVSDRIGVINNGTIVGEYRPPVDRLLIGKLMVGNF